MLKTVAERRENMLWFRTPEKVYFKKGCMAGSSGRAWHSDAQEESVYRNRYIPLQERICKTDRGEARFNGNPAHSASMM